MKGNHVEHWLNGAKVLEYQLDTDALRAKIADSKFKDIPDFDKHIKAHLLLQDHGYGVCSPQHQGQAAVSRPASRPT